MPPTINNLPTYAFSRNPLPVVLQSDDLITTPGVAAVNRLQLTAAVAAGGNIRLMWAGGDVVMTCANVPDGSGEQFPPTDPAVPAQMTALANACLRNYYLRRDFLIEAAGDHLDLTAKKSGVFFNMTPATNGNLTLSVATAGVNQVSKPNFRHFVVVKGAVDVLYSATLALDYPASAGKTTKDIAAILHANLSPDVPDLLAMGWQVCPNSFKTYTIEYGQYYGDTPKVAAITETSTRYVNKGALDMETFSGKTLQSFLVPGFDDTKTLCLRQGSKTVAVRTDQPEFLYWINMTGSAVIIQLQVTLTFTDGVTFSYFRFPLNAAPNSKYYVPVNYAALDILAQTPIGMLVSSYSVRVYRTDTQTFLSAAYNYEFDRYREHSHYIIYENSLGGFQTLYTWGKNEPSTDREKQDINLQLTDTEAAAHGRDRERTILLQEKILVNTGYRSPREIRLLNDIMASEQKYLVRNGRLVPIGLRNSTLAMVKDGENINGRQLEIYPLYKNWAYTDDPAQADNIVGGGGSAGALPTGPPNWHSGLDRLQDQINLLAAKVIPPGGVAGQVLSKANSEDYNTMWSNPPASDGGIDVGEPFTDVIIFTYNGSNHTHTLSYKPAQLGITSINGIDLDGYRDFKYVENTIVLDTAVVHLVIGTEYKLKTLYFK